MLTPLEQQHTCLWRYGNTAKYGFLDFGEKTGVDWMVGNPLDCYAYSSRSSTRVTAVLREGCK